MDDSDAQASSTWPQLEAVAQPARERRRLPPDTRSRIILELCALSPLSVKDLSILLDRSEAYIGDAIRPLVNSGHLTFQYPDQPRHPKQKYLTKATSRPTPTTTQPTPPTPAPAPAPEAPAPTPAPTPAPAPETPALSPAPELAPAQVVSDPEPAHFPNALTNIVVVIVVGILLATLRPDSWILFALAVSVALALAHIIANSTQYAAFLALQGSRSKRGFAFVLLKASVAMIEIIIVYYAASALTS